MCWGVLSFSTDPEDAMSAYRIRVCVCVCVGSYAVDAYRYVGSQWLAMPPSAARWLMEDRGLVPQYREYSKHIVVADENFLPTLMKNSPLCGNLVSSNLVHVQV